MTDNAGQPPSFDDVSRWVHATLNEETPKFRGYTTRTLVARTLTCDACGASTIVHGDDWVSHALTWASNHYVHVHHDAGPSG